MMQKIIVTVLVLFLIAGGLAMALLDGSRVGEAAAGTAIQEQILASTIQIEMYGAGRKQAGATYLRGTAGLGTLVQYGGQRFIVTHNHWSLLAAAELKSVELYSAAGERLLVLDATAFHALVRYQDGGTMLLAAPQPLPGVTPAAVGDGAALLVGDRVWLATYEVSGGLDVAVTTAQVERVDAASVPGQLQLRGPAAAVAPGDSGGGVWHDGKLVGNLWAIAVEPTSWPGSLWFGERRPTGAILAGMQPLSGAAGVFPGDLAPAADVGYERGPQRY